MDTENISESVTRKLGPLPVWGWGLVIVGAFVAFKIVGGNRQQGSQAEGGAAVGPGNTDTSGTGGGDDILSGPNSIVSQLQGANEQLQNEIGKLNDFQGLQLKLTNAINQRSSLLSTRNTLLTSRNGINDALRACKTTACKNTQKSKLVAVNKQITTNQSALDAINKVIADLSKQLTGAGAKTNA